MTARRARLRPARSNTRRADLRSRRSWREVPRLFFFATLLSDGCVRFGISSTSIYQTIHEAKLDKRLERLLLKLLEYNSTPNVQEPVRQFLASYQMMSDTFGQSYGNAHTFEDVLECYYQFAKNQCTITETLLQNLRHTLDRDGTRGELAAMLRDGFTF